MFYTGADPGFQVRGAHLKKSRRAEGDAKNFGVFRVKNHDFTTKNHIVSNCGGRREMFGVFRVKNHDFTPKNHIFSNFRGGARRVRLPPPGSAPDTEVMWNTSNFIHRYIKVESLRSTIYEYLNWQNARYVNHSA